MELCPLPPVPPPSVPLRGTRSSPLGKGDSPRAMKPARRPSPAGGRGRQLIPATSAWSGQGAGDGDGLGAVGRGWSLAVPAPQGLDGEAGQQPDGGRRGRIGQPE